MERSADVISSRACYCPLCGEFLELLNLAQGLTDSGANEIETGS